MTTKPILFLFFFLGFNFIASGQEKFRVKGTVVDSVNRVALTDATVTVLNAKDSVLVRFSYTDKGLFEINNLDSGQFLLIVTYPDYADFIERFSVNSGHVLHDFKRIEMISEVNLLKEVIVKARMASIKIKGDTTEFNAAAYKTQKNAKVEDLLKQLQGMKINQSGAIIFQGEQVSKVLVDGEEFFSDDPALVTNTVRADMVSKIQVYDDKSVEAKQTGVEDGKKVKTINIVLLEDKKRGLFGKADVGYGTDEYYTGQLMFNKFSPKEKASIYGNMGNTGKVGLSGADHNKFGAGYSPGDYGGNGLPFARDGGVHYDRKWNKDKQSVNVNYKTGFLQTEGISNSLTQNNLPGNFNKSSADRSFVNRSGNQIFEGNFRSAIDSVSDLSTYASASRYKYNSMNTTTSKTLRGNNVIQNSNDSRAENETDSRYFSFSASYTRRFKKKGRSLTVNSRINASDANSEGYQWSALTYYDGSGNQDSTRSINQFKPTISNSKGFSAGGTYTDVISKPLTISGGINYSADEQDNKRLAYDKSAGGMYDQLDTVFSSDYSSGTQRNGYNLTLNYSSGKSRASIGNNTDLVWQRQNDQFSSTSLARNFINWSPYGSFSYQLSKAASLNFNYNGYTLQPSIFYLQPIRQNSDPLNITIGNPDLKPEFEQRFSYNYRVYQPTKDQGINFRGNYTSTLNDIVQDKTIDSAGVSTIKYVNVRSKSPGYWNVYAEVYGHATKLDFIMSINLNVNGSTYYNLINGQLNRTKSVSYFPQLDIWTNKGSYSYSFSIGPNFSFGESSLQQQFKNNTRGFLVSGNFYTKLPGKFFIGADCSYKSNAGNVVFDKPFEQTLLKAYTGKTFLKDENLKLTITGNDLLDQNTGYSRSSSEGRFTESRNQTIRRYFIFTLTWDFSRFKKTLQRQES